MTSFDMNLGIFQRFDWVEDLNVGMFFVKELAIETMWIWTV